MAEYRSGKENFHNVFISPCILNHETVQFVQKLNLDMIKLKLNETTKLLSRVVLVDEALTTHREPFTHSPHQDWVLAVLIFL